MRVVVTVEEFRSFNEAQWREIRAVLAEWGIDLNTPVIGAVGTPFASGARWRSPDDPTTPHWPLRQALDQMVYFYARTKPATPIQLAERLAKELAAVEEVLAVLRSSKRPTAFERIYYSDDSSTLHQIDRDDTLRVLLTSRAAELQKRIAKLRAKGGNSSKNAATLRTDYWRELVRLCDEVTGGSGAKPLQRLRRFLIACTPATLFPDITAHDLKRKVDNFLRNRSHAQKRPT